MATANKDSFISSFMICTPLVSFYYFIALARTSSTVWESCGERGHPCFALDLNGKVLSSSQLSMMLFVGLFYRYSLSS